MSTKAILVFCAQALLAQSVFTQCIAGLGSFGSPLGLAGVGLNGFSGAGLSGIGLNGLAGAGLGLGGGYGGGCGGVASTGGGLSVSSASPVAPTGVSVVSENAYEGTLAAGGDLPILGTVAIEGVVPSAGAGAVSYGCGNGAAGIVSEGPIATGILANEAFAPSSALAAPGLGYGLGGIAGNGLGGIAGYGLGGIAGYGLGGIAGYGLGAGCGCSSGAIY